MIHLARDCSFRQVEQAHLTCLPGVWLLQSRHSFPQSSINGPRHHLDRQLQSLPAALCRGDSMHLKAVTRLLVAIEVPRRQRKIPHLPPFPNQAGWVLQILVYMFVCWLVVGHSSLLSSIYWQALHVYMPAF